MKITLDLLQKFAPNGDDDVLQAIVDAAPIVFPKYGITSALRLQHFFAQIAQETQGLSKLDENLNYSAARLRQVWPKRFPTLAAANACAHNARALAIKVYGSRMGNRAGTSDGYDYRGGGLAMLTGREAYQAVGKITGLPLEAKPDMVRSAGHMLEVACGFWKWKKVATAADADDIDDVTEKWNGGSIGLAERRQWLAKAKLTFTEDLDADATAPASDLDGPAPRVPDADDADDASPHGTQGVDIEVVQKRLKAIGYNEVGMIDGKWGGRMAAAIAAFKNDRHVDGPALIDDALKAELDKAEGEAWTRPISEDRANGVPDGSRIVDGAQKTGTVGAGLGGVGALGLLSQANDQVNTANGIVTTIKGWLAPFTNIIAEHWPVFLIAAGGIVLWQVARIRKARIEDHQSGKTP